jgi:hypothetical protein
MKHLSFIFFVAFSMLCSLSHAQINMSNATNTVNVPTAFYDDAGPSANYSSGLNLTQVMTTTTPNFRLKVVFASLFTQSAGDSLTIYNGTTPSPANFLVKYVGSPTTTAHYSTGNSMSFRFMSDATGNAAGWNSTVYPFGITALSQTTTAQSTGATFTVMGSNTDWTTGITNAYLVHSVNSTSIAVTSFTAVNATQLRVAFNIPCNASLGLYDLRVIQPTQGLTQMPNAFSVTSYSVALTGTNILCAFNNTGAITSTVTGGTGPYNYSYSPGTITTPNASNLSAGTYTLSVSDVNTCVRTQTVTLTQPASLSNGYPNSTSICIGQSAVLTMTASGGVGGYTYTWNGPNLSSTTTAGTTASPLSSTTYTYSVMDANACVASSTLIVNVNTPSTISITANPTQLCPGGTSTLSATGASTSYTWNNGATNYSTSVTPAGTTVYSVTGTSSNGCTKTETVNVTVNPNPVVSATTATPVCLGGNLNFINNSTGAGIYSWAGPSSYASTAASPMIPNITYAQAGTYTLSGMNAGTGCSASTTVSVTINALPSLTVTAPAAICAGISFTASGTGAATYTWMPGAVTGASQTFTPTASTTYTVSGTSAAGCIGTASANVGVNALTAINGTATASSNPVAGAVTLYAYEPFLTKFDSITTQNTGGTGAYTFTSVPAGSYIVKAVPTASTLQITYGSSAISWKNATVITHSCVNASSQNIAVTTFTNIGTGPGSLSGKITEGPGFGQRPSSASGPLAPGQPIKGVIVKGGKNPGGNMFAQTSTAADGTYTLSGLPSNAAGESYFLLVDIPGLDTNTTYHKIITVTNPNYTNLDFVVDSAKVNPVPSGATGMMTWAEDASQIRIYPNPATNRINVQYTLPESATVSIELFDLLGHSVLPLIKQEKQEAGTYTPSFTIGDLRAGVYVSRIRINNFETNTRIFITN